MLGQETKHNIVCRMAGKIVLVPVAYKIPPFRGRCSAAGCPPPAGEAGAGRLLKQESSHWQPACRDPVPKKKNVLPRGNAVLAQREAGQVPAIDNYTF